MLNEKKNSQKYVFCYGRPEVFLVLDTQKTPAYHSRDLKEQ